MGCHCLVEAQLAIDTTLVSALRRDGTAREGAANRNGVAIRSAHRRKERTYVELAVQGDVLGWSSLPARLADVGRPRQHISCGLWQLRRFRMFQCFASQCRGCLVPLLVKHPLMCSSARFR